MEQTNLFNEGMTELSLRTCVTTLQTLATWFNAEKYNIHFRQAIADYYNQLTNLLKEEEEKRIGTIANRSNLE